MCMLVDENKINTFLISNVLVLFIAVSFFDNEKFDVQIDTNFRDLLHKQHSTSCRKAGNY